MTELATAAIALLCMCAGIALGFLLRVALRETVTEAKEIVGDGGVTGLVALCTLLIGALSVSGAIFLMEELYSPLNGLIVVSTEPLQRTLATFCP